MVKYTSEDHPGLFNKLFHTPIFFSDFQHLCEALVKIQEVATKINEAKRVAEHMNLILEISRKMELEDLVQPFRYVSVPFNNECRRFLKEGPVLKEATTKNPLKTMVRALSTKYSQYYFYLFSDILILAR